MDKLTDGYSYLTKPSTKNLTQLEKVFALREIVDEAYLHFRLWEIYCQKTECLQKNNITNLNWYVKSVIEAHFTTWTLDLAKLFDEDPRSLSLGKIRLNSASRDYKNHKKLVFNNQLSKLRNHYLAHHDMSRSGFSFHPDNIKKFFVAASKMLTIGNNKHVLQVPTNLENEVAKFLTNFQGV